MIAGRSVLCQAEADTKLGRTGGKSDGLIDVVFVVFSLEWQALETMD
jgi:hypothetical protein